MRALACRADCRLPTGGLGAGKQHNHFRVDAIEFAVVQPPEDILGHVGAPPEIGRIPAEEITLPAGKPFGIVGCVS